MDRTERFYKIESLLRSRRAVPVDTFLDELGVSRATFKRDLEYLRDRLHAPIVYSRELGGYAFEEGDVDGPGYELPGLWFNASEIHALLTMDQLLDTLQPGLLGPHIEPLRARISTILESTDQSAEAIRGRIKLMNTGSRPVKPENFEQVAHALLQRSRIRIRHHNRGNGEYTERSVSPQRLTYFKGTWYLDAWCHMRKGVRRFGMDAIELLSVEAKKAKELSPNILNKELSSGYGIFAGSKTHTADLLFTPARSQWVSHEIWHSEQEGVWESDGSYRLKIPYTNEREMVSELLHYGSDVRVISPVSLMKSLLKEAQKVIDSYA